MNDDETLGQELSDQTEEKLPRVPPSSACPNSAHLRRRRLANDPEMMHELHRYRRLMLLTLLPNISKDSSEASPLHPHAHIHTNQTPPAQQLEESPKRFFISRVPSPTATTGILPELVESYLPESNDLFDRSSELENSDEGLTSRKLSESMHNYSYLSTDEGSSDHLSRSVGFIGNNGSSSAELRKRLKSAGSETRLPIPSRGLIPVDQSRGDRRSVSKMMGVIAPHPGGEPSGASYNGHADTDTSELDLLTLAELYLESRHRVFGEEWNQRQRLNKTGVTGVTANKVGNIGANQRPHRLMPLPKESLQAPILPKINTKGMGIPAPGGLHLSVNYTHNLDMEATLTLMDRARALKPRFRRLNSLDDISATPDDEFDLSESNLYRPTSAPDVNKKQMQTKEFLDGVDSSPPQITPARANTPTSAARSSDRTKTELVGPSLATSLARISSSRPGTRDSAKSDGSSSSDGKRSPTKITGLFPDNPPPSLSASFRGRPDPSVKHISDLGILKELQATLHNELNSGKLQVDAKSRVIQSKGGGMQVDKLSLKNDKKVVAPIGSSIDTNTDEQTDANVTKLSAIDQQNANSKSGNIGMKIDINNRPLHHSLPTKLIDPLATQSTIVNLPNANLRKNSRVMLSPIDPSRKVSAP